MALFPSIIEKATRGYNQVLRAPKGVRFTFFFLLCCFLNGKKGKKKKVFLLHYLLVVVLPKLSEGCAWPRTLIRIFAPEAEFASCTAGEPDTDHCLPRSRHMIGVGRGARVTFSPW